MSGMTTRQAINIVSKEMLRCEIVAEALAEEPLDHEGKILERARERRELAEAMRRLVHIARVFESMGQE